MFLLYIKMNSIFFYIKLIKQVQVKVHSVVFGNSYLIGTRLVKEDSHYIGSPTIPSWMRSGREVIVIIFVFLYSNEFRGLQLEFQCNMVSMILYKILDILYFRSFLRGYSFLVSLDQKNTKHFSSAFRF